MAAPATSAEQAQATQETLASLAVPLLHAAWSLFQPDRLDQSVPRFREAVAAVVNRYGGAAAAQAVQHFRAVRLDAGVSSPVQVPLLSSVPDGFIDQAVTESLAIASVRAEVDAALADARAEIEAATSYLDSQAQQLILEQGRRQMMSAVAVDREAKGWARVPNVGACSFCMMLALRAGQGLLYRSKSSASFKAHTKKPNGSGGDCRCSVEPVFGHYEPPAAVRDAERVWAESTKGRSGHDARVAFRQAMEGREVTGAPSKSSKSKAAGRTYDAPQGKTVENQRAQLKILEALPPAKTPEAAAWRRDRVAEIRRFLGE